jgi:hypothetical protein
VVVRAAGGSGRRADPRVAHAPVADEVDGDVLALDEPSHGGEIVARGGG